MTDTENKPEVANGAAKDVADTENKPEVANSAAKDVVGDTEAKAEAAKGDVAVVSPLEKKIIRQIEYYFGDYNMPRDKFIQVQASSLWSS